MPDKSPPQDFDFEKPPRTVKEAVAILDAVLDLGLKGMNLMTAAQQKTMRQAVRAADKFLRAHR